MFRPIFSASHSAKFQKSPNSDFLQPENRHLWTPAGQAERRAELWGPYAETPVTPSTSSGTLPPEYEEEEMVDVVQDEDNSPFMSSHGDTIKLPSVSSRAQTVVHPPRRLKMALKPRLLVSLWFIVTIPIIFWDATYCFMRPRSMEGGDLHWMWPGYHWYAKVDHVYGLRALQNGEGFTNAQSLLNIVENCMNILYLYLAHVSRSPVYPLIGFASTVMTLSKTILYAVREHFCDYCYVGHNDLRSFLIFYVIPNGFWLIFPSIIIYQLGKDIYSVLRAAQNEQLKIKSGKSE